MPAEAALLRSLSALLVLLGGIASAAAADQATCQAHLTDLIGRCARATQQSAAPGDFSYFAKCKAKHMPDYQRCMAGGGMTGAAQMPPVACAEAKVNIDWIFRDSGASRTFSGARQRGLSRLDAALFAQGHNPRAQKTIRDCANWATAYLGSIPAAGIDPPVLMSDKRLSQQDCTCISVLPTNNADFGGRRAFRVLNKCSLGIEISVRFVEKIPENSRSSWSQAGLMGQEERTIRAPAFNIASIAAVQLRDAASTYTCRME